MKRGYLIVLAFLCILAAGLRILVIQGYYPTPKRRKEEPVYPPDAKKVLTRGQTYKVGWLRDRLDSDVLSFNLIGSKGLIFCKINVIDLRIDPSIRGPVVAGDIIKYRSDGILEISREKHFV